MQLLQLLKNYITTNKQKNTAVKNGCILCKDLLLHDLQQIHGTGLHADAAGDALCCGAVRLHDHDLHGAGFHTLAAGNAQLLVDHVNTGLGILSDGAILTSLHALTALDAGHGLGTGALCHDLDAAQVGMELFVERGRASTNALQASHALHTFFRH